MAAINNMSESADDIENAMEGSLYKMKKGITGSNYWKKHWVYADNDYLYQWQSNNKPKGEAPKYTCCLADCNIEESQVRKFAFKITEKSSKETMTFAAEDFNSYECWLKILFGNIVYDESERSEEKSEAASTYSEDFKHVTSDKIADYFFEHDVAKVAAPL